MRSPGLLSPLPPSLPPTPSSGLAVAAAGRDPVLAEAVSFPSWPPSLRLLQLPTMPCLEKPPVCVLTCFLARSSAYFPVVFLTNTLVNSLACLLAGVR